MENPNTLEQLDQIIGLLKEILAATKANGGGAKATDPNFKEGVFSGWKAARVPSWAKFDGGVQFGDLSGKALAFWLGYQPKGFQGAPPKAEDMALRKMLDQAQQDIDSGEYKPPQYTNKPKESKATTPKPAARPAPSEAQQANVSDDTGEDVPF